jgi:hypothetical protein
VLTCAAVQMDGVKRDSARVINENNQLHVQLIREAEKYDAQQTKHYQKVKSLEGEIAELSFWKHQALNRMDASEKDAASLKGRLQELMKLGAPDWLQAHMMMVLRASHACSPVRSLTTHRWGLPAEARGLLVDDQAKLTMSYPFGASRPTATAHEGLWLRGCAVRSHARSWLCVCARYLAAVLARHEQLCALCRCVPAGAHTRH